jgi:hypothetical protein
MERTGNSVTVVTCGEASSAGSADLTPLNQSTPHAKPASPPLLESSVEKIFRLEEFPADFCWNTPVQVNIKYIF